MNQNIITSGFIDFPVIKVESIILFLFFVFICTGNSISQTGSLRNTNIAPEAEKYNSINNSSDEVNLQIYQELEKKHKAALESGRISDAEQFESRMKNLVNPENIFQAAQDQRYIMKNPSSEDPQTDWMNSSNPMLLSGPVNTANEYFRQLDLKYGEDGNVYAAVNSAPNATFKGSINVYKSSNSGLNWQMITTFTFANEYVSNIAMLVESRNKNIPDSTRIIIFHTLSSNSNYDGARLEYVSFRRNLTGMYGGILATPGAGHELSFISAVSDGAFWEDATYFGVLVTESDNALTATQSIRYCRTQNWGAFWTGITISTSFNDFYISADLKPGTPDSIWIACERRFPAAENQIRILSTRFTPTAAFQTYYITSGESNHYVRPCLTIQQHSPCDSVAITVTRSGYASYFYNTAGGAIWNGPNYFATGNNKKFTHCSSSPGGLQPFSFSCSTISGDSLLVRKSRITGPDFTNFKSTAYKTSTAMGFATVNIDRNGYNGTTVLYAGEGSVNAYASSDGARWLNIFITPQGFYNPATIRLNMRDTVTAYVRRYNSPYNIIDSSKAILDSVTQRADFLFKNAPTGAYYISVKHRNSLETWSSGLTALYQEIDFFNMNSISTLIYEQNVIELVGPPQELYGIYSGDVDQNGSINLTDIISIHNAASNFAHGYIPTDVTGDRVANLTDVIMTYNNSNNFVHLKRPF